MAKLNNRVEATILGLQQFSSDDGPGIRRTVFFKGCPSQCLWCTTSESSCTRPEIIWHPEHCAHGLTCVKNCPSGALSYEDGAVVFDVESCTSCAQCVALCKNQALEMYGHTINVQELSELLIGEPVFCIPYQDGVTLAGGEPLAQPTAVLSLLKLLKKAHMHVALCTCGTCDPEVLKQALPLVDLVIFQLTILPKDPQKTRDNGSISPLQRVAEIINASRVPVWVRTPIIPDHTDSEETMAALAGLVAQSFDYCERHELRSQSKCSVVRVDENGVSRYLVDAPLPSTETMKRLCYVARKNGSISAHWAGSLRMLPFSSGLPN